MYAYLALYAAACGCLFFYGMHAYWISGTYLRVRARANQPSPPATWPKVTVQLPIFNEYYVVERLLRAACALDYPRHRLEVQVLDDSTDDTAERVDQLCNEYLAQGIRIHHVRRPDRRGFKGGALSYGLHQAQGELVCLFDADFLPPRHFLRATVPHFQKPAVGMVQCRWGHLNDDYSALTRVQALALDGHFIVEQTARNRLGCFINFNGTAGIWRRQCIVDAGNWQTDTLTEDLDLSYRAQLAGWQFVYLPEVVCPAELPADVNGFKAQQFRWAKGSMQTALKLLPTTWRAALPVKVKLQATVHLTNHLVYPLLWGLALSSLPALWITQQRPEVAPLFQALAVLVIASFGHPFLYAVAHHGAQHPPRCRRRWLDIPLIIAGGMGISINNTRAVWEALRRRPSPFLRTPKYDLVKRTDSWQRKRYRTAQSPSGAAELGMALYVAAAALYAAVHQSWGILPFLLLYVAGFAYIGGLSLVHGGRLRWITSTAPHRQSGTANSATRVGQSTA